MNINSMKLTNTLTTKEISGPSSFKPGQILYGKVHYIDQFGHARLQIGHEIIVAKIEAPLDVQKDYWFEVMNTEGKVQLKVLENIHHYDSLLSYLKLPNHSRMKQLLVLWNEQNLPFDKTILNKCANWIHQETDVNKVIETVKFMLKEHLPLTNNIFNSLYSLKNGVPLSSMIEHLFFSLNNDERIQNLPLLKELELLLTKRADSNSFSNTNWGKGNDVFRVLHHLTNLFSFKERVDKEGSEESIRLNSELVKILQLNHVGNQVKIDAEKVLNRLNGIQLNNIDKNDFLQLMITLPIPFKEKLMDTSIQFIGKKRDDGILDPDYCNIILDLDMPNVGKVISRMYVQNRKISIHILSGMKNMEILASPFTRVLNDNLEKINYTLVSLKFDSIDENDRKSTNEVVQTIQPGSLDVKI
ncbi:hypothetical protein [Bacillus andreraoultii]|uniref:hypothetical protein n=1 Tax=Bacillus andreraoultii TaxID=1499685 RepID=UPI00053B5EF1|nr:hypothetical protein [Bacillus andreraoultii]